MSGSSDGAPLDLSAIDTYVARLDVAECALLAQQFAALGAFREVVALCSRHAARGVVPGLRLCEARGRFALGEHARALAIVDEVLAAAPSDLLALFQRAQLYAQLGRAVDAKRDLVSLIAEAADFPGALAAFARLCLPGPPYRDVLTWLHEQLRPRVYLEIGVEHGHSLQLARHSEVVIGVDPGPAPSVRPLPAGARFFQQTSDAFFAAHEPTSLLGERRVELAFIDGLHRYDVALRDFHSVERWCTPASLVVMHDCLPVARVAAAPARRTHFWVGDTWKAVEYLYAHRPELTIHVVPTYPSGLVLITGLRPERAAKDVTAPAFEDGVPSGDYPYPLGEWSPQHRWVPNSEHGLFAWLAEYRTARGGSSR